MERYDVVVLGGGSGSQVATAAAAEGLEAAVVEPGPLGGACITRGCVPSKALVHRADVVEEVRRAESVGVTAEVTDVDFGAVTAAVREAVYDKAERQAESLRENDRVALYDGEGRFVDEREISIDGAEGTERIRGEHVVVAVGGRPTTPPIDGLEDVDYLTSEDALFLDELPDSLAIVGGGYIGAELGYVFGALGGDVSIVGRSDRLVPREDDDVSTAVTGGLERHCDVCVGHEVAVVEETDSGVAVTAEPVDGGDALELEVDDLLVAAGRRPNTDALDLEEAGVETNDDGHVAVDETLESSADAVWALGDVVGEQPYKHAADYEARVVAANILDDAERTIDYRAMPHAIFTAPRVASVGRTEAELEEEGREYEAATVPYGVAPLGTILEAEEAFVKALAAPDGEVLGCHVVGLEAPTLIQEVVVAMDGGGTVDDIADAVHVHPALSEVVVAAFDDLSARPYSTAPDWRDVDEL